MDNKMNGYNNTNNSQPGQGGNSENGGNGGPNKNNRRNIIMLVVSLGIFLFFLWSTSRMMSGTMHEEISYSQFVQMLEDGQVEEVVVEDELIYIYPKKEEKEPVNKMEELLFAYYGQGHELVYVTAMVEDYSDLTARVLAADAELVRNMPDSTGSILYLLLTSVLPLVLMVVFFTMMMKKMSGKGGMFGMGKSTAKVYVQKETGVTFKDVAGEDEAKESLVEVVDFLHNPGKYAGIGARLPKGALLVGPPGTGKTLLAKAVAGEAGVPFFSLTGSDFVELYVGMGASRVRSLFEEANKNAPCIIFIDEIDAIGRSRDSKYGGGNEEREQTLNQLLSEMDGFDSSKGILIPGA
ncbi:MAG: ATP-dependent metallopeptidase FtsH/Yme1/Tma family protein, partial [Lachnospiraceae bacterium]|nr:ATP-dependent metallopeptidase FtsH/Yme1/Tma family protein [Lachnospiraceae bacterium]